MLFYLNPQTAAFKNNSSALKHSDFVESSILELLCPGEFVGPPNVISGL